MYKVAGAQVDPEIRILVEQSKVMPAPLQVRGKCG
jgi:hypothetical protein